MRTCDTCNTEKPDAKFRPFGRGRKKTCLDCEGNDDPEQAATAAPAPADAGLRAGPALSIAPGLGIEAWIENGCLQMSQGDDVVALSKTEFRVLAAQFEEWAAA